MSILRFPPGPLTGEIEMPGDKSISHRAAVLGSIASGTTHITNYAPGADCTSTLRVLRSLGVRLKRRGNEVTIKGSGPHGLTEPEDVLDCGNSGTTMRIMSGLLAAQPFVSILTGDRSLRSRPMDRVIKPLRLMGATIHGRAGGKYAPVFIEGGRLRSITYESPVASAQVKSAILLAGLYAEGSTTVVEPAKSRDHTERMLLGFGATVTIEGLATTVSPGVLRGQDIRIPGDISSAAFFVTAASLVPGSEVMIRNVGFNPTRTGFIDVMKSMGAQIESVNIRTDWGEPVCDILVRHSQLNGITIDPALVPRAIDEIPIIAVAATQAHGTTIISGAGELRVKESDRLRALAINLGKMGARVTELPDGLVIEGPTRLAGARVQSHGDHRIAMSLVVASLIAEGTVDIDDLSCVEISYPGFVEALSFLLKERG